MEKFHGERIFLQSQLKPEIEKPELARKEIFISHHVSPSLNFFISLKQKEEPYHTHSHKPT